MALFVFVWSLVGRLLYELLLLPFPTGDGWGILRTCLALLIGFTVPQAALLKDMFLTRRIAKRFLFLQAIDEQTRLYWSRILTREERKANIKFLDEDTDSAQRGRALDRLFEYHNVEIVREEAKRHTSPEAALGIFKSRLPAVKFKFLLRYLGYSDCLRELRRITAKPGMIFPTWPSDQGDRRKGSPTAGSDTTASLTRGRRKYEDPDLRAYALGFPGSEIRKKYQVFVSSTYLDLKEERQQVLKALLGCDCIPAGMEFFPSSDEELWTLIKSVVDECDYYILLIGGRYGSTTRDGISYTEAEYDYAVRQGKPVLAFLQVDPRPYPGESAASQQRLLELRERLCNAHAPAYWSHPDEIPTLVHQAVERVKKKQPGKGWIRIGVGPTS